MPKRLEQRNTSLWPPKPQGSTGVLQFIYTEAGFAARFEPPTPPTATLLDTQLSPTISSIPPFCWACENKEAHVWQLLHAESLGATVESSDRNDSPNGSVPFFCRGPSLPAFSVPDCDESGRKWLPLFKSYVLTKPKLQWTENKQAQFMKKYTDYSSPLVSFQWLQGNCNSTEGGLSILGENKASFKSSFIYSSQLCWVYWFSQLFP